MTTALAQEHRRQAVPACSSEPLLAALVTGLARRPLRRAHRRRRPRRTARSAGTLLVVGVFFLGAASCASRRGLVPAASLLVALLTYTLQVLVLALVFAALSRSGLLDDASTARWLAGAVIAGTVAWMVAQIVLTARLRLPVYDLPSRPTRTRRRASRAAGGGCTMTHSDCYCPGRNESAETTAWSTGTVPGRPVARVRVPRRGRRSCTD